MKLERLSIPVGDIQISGLLYKPDTQRSRICLVLAHGFTASKTGLDGLAGYLSMRGYGCLTFDFRGHKLGCSSGDLNHAAETLDDLESAISFAVDSFECPRCVVVGHSMGALAGLLVGSKMESVAGVAAIATGPRPS